MSDVKLKKTDSIQLEKVITLIISVVIIGLPIAYFLQFFHIVKLERTDFGEIVMEASASILLLFDIMYWKQKENRYISILGVILILFAGSLILSTIYAKSVSLAIAGNSYTKEGSIAMLSYLILLYNSSLIGDRKNRRVIIISLLFFGVIEVIVGVLQAVFQLEILKDELAASHYAVHRALGTIINANPYGSVMVLVAGLTYGMFYVAKGKKSKFINAILCVGFTYAVLLSGTRGAWVGLAATAFVGSVVALIYESRKGEIVNGVKKLGCVLGFVIIAVLIFAIVSSETMGDAIDRSQSDVARESFGEERPLIWKNCYDMCFRDNPILGIGVSNIHVLVSMTLTEDSYTFFTTSDAHNRYLHILCTQGIVGLITYMLLIGYIIIFMIKKMRKGEFNSTFPLFVAIIGWCVADIFSIGNTYMTPYFYIMLGLAVSRKETLCLLGKKNKALNNN